MTGGVMITILLVVILLDFILSRVISERIKNPFLYALLVMPVSILLIAVFLYLIKRMDL